MIDGKYEKLYSIRCVITDIDGVLTDGGMHLLENGIEAKKFNVRDGAGVVLLKNAGLFVGAITGEHSKLILERMRKIGMNALIMGVKDKNHAIDELANQQGLDLQEIAYIGDEINDYCLIGKVGAFFVVADAAPEVLENADFVLKKKGGEGALREVAQIILNVQGKIEHSLDSYWCNSRECDREKIYDVMDLSNVKFTE